MMEGGSAEKYNRALKLFHEDRQTFYKLAEKLTAAITAYLQMQINAGVDALQIFDSHGGQLAPKDFPEASGRWLRDIISELSGTARHSVRAVNPYQRARHCFFPRHARKLGRSAGDRRECAGHRLAISTGARAPAFACGYCSSRQPFPHASQRRHAGSCRPGNAGRSRGDAGTQRAYFQPWTWSAAHSQAGKHRRIVRNGEEFQMKNSIQRGDAENAEFRRDELFFPLRFLCVLCASALFVAHEHAES